jgi:hypothetical protein
MEGLSKEEIVNYLNLINWEVTDITINNVRNLANRKPANLKYIKGLHELNNAIK